MLLISGFTFSAIAQRGEGRKMKATPERRTEMRLNQLEKKLGITAEQRQKLSPTLLSLEKEREALTSDVDNVKGRRMELMKKADAAILEVLTPDQKVNYEKLKAERKAKMRDRMENKMLEMDGIE